MSRHPSPGPSHPTPTPQIVQQSSARHKQKQIPVGIAAGAEDAKYQAKYKELKRKVKEIEADNDKLHFKVLQAKRNIQRMRLERAILYERLASVPPSPELQERQPIPPVQSGPGIPPQPPHVRSVSGPQQYREHAPNDQDNRLQEYIRTHGNPRVAPGPDGRPVPVLDAHIGPGVPPVHSPRRVPSGSTHDLRQLPPLPSLTHSQQYDNPRGHSGHPHGHHASPPSYHPHLNSSHERGRSRSRTRANPLPSYQQSHGHPQYPEHSHAQHIPHSPPSSERERSRRHELHEGSLHSDPHVHGHHSTSTGQLSPPDRFHSHQRVGPASYINRDEIHERGRDRHVDLERERERERDWERGRDLNRDTTRNRDYGSHMHSPPTLRAQQPERGEYHDYPNPSRNQHDPYYHDGPPHSGPYLRVSRSDTPASGSGSGSGVGGVEAPSRPDSRTQFYENERSRSFRLRPVNQPNEDVDFVHEDGRSQSRDHGGTGGNFPPSESSRPLLESRKRTRNDVDMDADNEDAPTRAPSMYSSGRMQDDRGSKRYQREHSHRGVDNQEDDRMGPP